MPDSTIHEGQTALAFPLSVEPPFIVDDKNYVVAVINDYEPDGGVGRAGELVRIANEHPSLSNRVEELVTQAMRLFQAHDQVHDGPRCTPDCLAIFSLAAAVERTGVRVPWGRAAASWDAVTETRVKR